MKAFKSFDIEDYEIIGKLLGIVIKYSNSPKQQNNNNIVKAVLNIDELSSYINQKKAGFINILTNYHISRKVKRGTYTLEKMKLING